MPLNWSLIGADVLCSLELDKIVESVTEKECVAYNDVLTTLIADEARWSEAQLEALRFSSAVMSMMLRPSELSEPYGPMFVMGNERSGIPADFPKEALIALLDWASGLKDPELRARFLDLIWVQGKSFRAAQGAVDAYLKSASRLEHSENWPPCAERIERALRLAASLGKGGHALRDRVLTEIEALTNKHNGEDPLYLTHQLIGLLLEFKRGDARCLAQLAATAAGRAESVGDFWRARDYHQRVAECFAAAGDIDAESAALKCSAEALSLEAESATGQPGRGATAGAVILAQAVNAMRQVPGGKDRAQALQERLLILQAKSLEEMKPISTDFDGADLVERAIASVRGKNFRDAVIELCGMARAPSLEQLRQQVSEQSRIAVLGSIFQSDIVNARGRVVAKVPPLVLGVTDPNDPGLRWRMFQNAALRRSLVVQSLLNPARQEIVAVHHPSRQDVVDLIRHSPWIPPGHGEGIARALIAGFHGEMLVATHMIPSQFEAMVRHVVELAGGNTSMFDPQGLQPERSFKALLETEQALAAFGEAAIFELQDLFVDQLGTNLRNDVAHGLLDDGRLFGWDALYAWWLLLRYCLLTSLYVDSQVSRKDREP